MRKVFSFEIFLPFCKLYPPPFAKDRGLQKKIFLIKFHSSINDLKCQHYSDDFLSPSFSVFTSLWVRHLRYFPTPCLKKANMKLKSPLSYANKYLTCTCVEFLIRNYSSIKLGRKRYTMERSD